MWLINQNSTKKLWFIKLNNCNLIAYLRVDSRCKREYSLNLKGKSSKNPSNVLSLWLDSTDEVKTKHLFPCSSWRRTMRESGFKFDVQICNYIIEQIWVCTKSFQWYFYTWTTQNCWSKIKGATEGGREGGRDQLVGFKFCRNSVTLLPTIQQ